MRLRIASLNVWALPWPIARAVSFRMESISARLADLRADVIALQEVWTGAARERLVEAGRRAGLPHVWHNRATRSGSGLVVLSRWPLQSAEFFLFALRGHPEKVWQGDYHGGKGFALLRLETPAGDVAFVDTHLHAQYGGDASDDAFAHRVGQVVQLAAALAPVREPLVAAGDFNMREDRPEYRIFTGLTGLRDAAAQLDRRSDTVLASNPYRGRGTIPGARIDYVFARDGARRRVQPLALHRIFDEPIWQGDERHAYSDHAGVLAELEVRPGEPAPPPAPAPDAVLEARRILAAGRERAVGERTQWRLGAGGLLAGAAALVAAAPRLAASRRRTLRAPALLLAPAGLVAGMRAEWFGPEELRAFDATLGDLDAIGGADS